MWDVNKQQQLNTLQQQAAARALTPEESQQLSQLLHELEQEEWQALRPALQQMRDEQSQLQQEKAMLQAQNAVLAAIAERQADLLARAKAQLIGSVLLAICIVCGLLPSYAQTKPKKTTAKPTGFKSIFNGKDLTDWEGDPKHWTVEDGALTGTTDGTLKANSFIVWRGGTVKNFELLVKVKITQGGNSGLQYRSVPFPDAGPYVLTGYQCDIVTTKDEYDGMLYDERGRRILAQSGTRVVIDPNNEKWIVGSVGEIKHFPAGEWHEYHVIVRGNHHQHFIDGHKTVEVFDHDANGRRLEGLLGVQVHVGPAMKVQFKDWRLKGLPEAPLVAPEKTPIPPNSPKVPVQGAPQKKS